MVFIPACATAWAEREKRSFLRLIPGGMGRLDMFGLVVAPCRVGLSSEVMLRSASQYHPFPMSKLCR